MMDVAILIMATDSEPSISNIKGMTETFIKRTQEGLLNNRYEFILYTGNSSPNSSKPSLTEIDCNHKNGNVYKYTSSVSENIYKTFEKTYDTLEFLDKSRKKYDWYVRINISAWLNISLLDKVITQLDEDIVYCNAINSIISDEKFLNDLYPRGDFFMFSHKVKDGILKEGEKYLYCDIAEKDRLNVPHVDDCMIGLSLIDYFGKYYYKHLKMLKYNYIPYNEQDAKQYKILQNAICSRVKTLPPNVTYSGYSWDDNEYRRYDSRKMKMLDTAYSNTTYDNIKLKDLEVDESLGRPTLLVYMSNVTVDNFYKYLDSKR